MIAVYLNDFSIYVVEGTTGKGAAVSRIYNAVLPMGLISSGVAINEQGLSAFLADFWKKNRISSKNVVLILGSTQLVNKVIEAPVNMKEEELLAFFSREFTEFGHGSDMAYGSWSLEEKKKEKRNVWMVTSADKDYVKKMEQIFAAADIRVQEVVSKLSGMLAMLLDIPGLRGKSCIVQQWDGQNLMNVLLVEGRYVYSNNQTLPYNPGTPAFAVGVARQVSQIMQFMMAQNMTARVEHIYLTGIRGEDFEICADSIMQMNPALTVDALPGMEQYGNALPAAGALKIPVSRLSLIRQSKVDAEARKERAAMQKRFRPIAVIGCVALALCLGVFAINRVNHSRLRRLDTFNQSPEVMEAVAEHEQLSATNQTLTARLRALEQDTQAIQQYPSPSSRVNEVFQRCAGDLVEVRVSSYDAENGVFLTEMSARQVDHINQFVAVLAQEEIFSQVDYSGYSYHATTDSWSVNVVCTLASEAGK